MYDPSIPSWSYIKWYKPGAGNMGHPRDAEIVEFDEGNESEMSRHGVSSTEVMQVLENQPVWSPNKKGRSGEWKVIGYTNGGRALTIPVTWDERRHAVRPITAWSSSTHESMKYLKGRKQ